MDALGSYLVAEIIKALGEGNLIKFGAYIAIFLILWLEIHGIKKSIKSLNKTIEDKMLSGDVRFAAIEKNQNEFEHRLNLMEQKN